MQKTIKGLNDQIVDLKKDAKETISQIKYDSKEAVVSTKEYSENEISRISLSTKQAALDETQKQLSYILGLIKFKI